MYAFVHVCGMYGYMLWCEMCVFILVQAYLKVSLNCRVHLYIKCTPLSFKNEEFIQVLRKLCNEVLMLLIAKHIFP